MSRITLSGNASGTGNFTLASPNSNTDRTLTLPDNTGTVLTTASTVSATQIAGALNASGSAPIYACRAWVNFNGTGTVAINASGNVSSITDNGTGDYTINFTTAMPDANYSSVCSTATTVNTDGRHISPRDFATNSVRVTARNGSGTTAIDTEINCVAIFR
jgi:hypothetical protein